MRLKGGRRGFVERREWKRYKTLLHSPSVHGCGKEFSKKVLLVIAGPGNWVSESMLMSGGLPMLLVMS